MTTLAVTALGRITLKQEMPRHLVAPAGKQP